MINKQFGTYLVLLKNEILSKEKGRVYWTCECQKCKSIQNVRTDGLKRLPSVCPECKNNISGQKYGKLTVLYKTKTDINGHSYWMCECECGNQKEVSSSNLKSGKTQSCGCLHKKITSELNTKDLIYIDDICYEFVNIINGKYYLLNTIKEYKEQYTVTYILKNNDPYRLEHVDKGVSITAPKDFCILPVFQVKQLLFRIIL